MNTRNFISLFIWITITFVSFCVFNQIQIVLDYTNCEKCDGNQYLLIQSFFSEKTNYQVHFPFNSRIFQPFLVSKSGLSFSFYNLLFAISTIITLFIIWKKLNIKPVLISIGLFWLLFHWSGIVRYYAFDPISVDVPVYFFHSLLVLIIITKKYKWLWLVAPIAFLVKESFLAYILIFLIFSWLYNSLVEQYFPVKTILIALGLVVITKILVNIYFPPIEEGMNSFRSVAFYIRGILQNPLELFRWIIAIFTSFGGLLLLSLINFRKNFKPNPEQNLILMFSIVSILFGLIAGGDRTRIIFIGFPFVMTSIFYIIQNRGLGVTIIALLISIPLMRLASFIPPINSTEYNNWFPEFADLSMVCAWAFYMFFCYFIIQKADGFFSK